MTMNLKCISEWDRCLPQPDELTPLSQKLIPHELACAFNILPSSSSSTCTAMTPSTDVLNASHSAFKSLLHMRSVRGPSAESEWKDDAETALPLYQGKVDDDLKPHVLMQAGKQGIGFDFRGVPGSQAGTAGEALLTGRISPSAADEDYRSASFLPPGIETGLSQLMSSASYMHNSPYPHVPESTAADVSHNIAPLGDRAARARGSILEAANLMQLKMDPSDEIDSPPSTDFFQGSSATMSSEEQSARTLKKPRLVWTPQLHKRFVDAVAHLGIKHAVPKTIMQLMNVDGLTRENVASHLQKYRLYLKRMQGFSGEGPSASDHLFASTPVPPSLAASAHYLVSHHSQQADHSFGAVQNANLPSILGHPARLLTPGMCSTTPSFSGFNSLPSVSTLQRAAPPPLPLISSELSYVPPSNSAPGQVLSFFPNSFK